VSFVVVDVDVDAAVAVVGAEVVCDENHDLCSCVLNSTVYAPRIRHYCRDNSDLRIVLTSNSSSSSSSSLCLFVISNSIFYK
jgi:hypothetical protein